MRQATGGGAPPRAVALSRRRQDLVLWYSFVSWRTLIVFVLRRDETMSSERMTARQFVGREIRIAREAKGLSRASLAQLFTVSESTIRWWESGRPVPGEQYVASLTKFVDLSETVRRVIDDLASNEVAPEWLGRWVLVVCWLSLLLLFVLFVFLGLFLLLV